MPNDGGNKGLNNKLISTVAGLLEVGEDEVRSKSSSNFIQLGGDSVRALQLTFQLDEIDLPLDLETILDEDSSLEELSRILGPSSGDDAADADEEPSSLNDDEAGLDEKTENLTTERKPNGEPESGYKPFALLPETEVNNTIQEAAKQIECSADDIEDILPVTSQQKLLWLGSLQKPGTYLAHWCFDVPESVDEERLRKAWLEVLGSAPILRARFVLDVNDSLCQAIVSASKFHELWTERDNEAAATFEPDYGLPLVKYGIENSSSGTKFHLHAHHAVYDRWSMQLTFDDFRCKYNEAPLSGARPSFVPYLEPIKPTERDELATKWKGFLGDTFLTPVPDLAATEDKPSGANERLERSCHLSSSSATKAELVTAAWSWVCSRQANSSDVSFGLTVWGRDVPLLKVTEMVFPTFRTLPICMRLQPEDSTSGLLKKTKSTLSSLRHLQRLNFEQISSISDVSKQACRFNSIVVVQSEPAEHTYNEGDVLRPKDLISFDLKQGHQLVVECTPSKGKMNISLHYHADYIATEFAEALLSHFCMALEALSSGGEELCDNIDLFSDKDDRLVREWTRPCEEAKSVPMYAMVEKQATETPDAIALWSTQSKMSYSELIDKSESLAQLLRTRDATGHVGVCLERSAMAVIAQIGVSMSGCAFIPLDPSNPTARLEQIVKDSDMSLLLCSQTTSKKIEGMDVHTLVLDGELLQSQKSTDDKKRSQPKPTDKAYIIYTSGSTGSPKGVIIQHEQISTSLSAQTAFFDVNRETRTLQFASLAFDMSIHEIYMTLGAGGTVCIPTDAERFELDDFLAEAKPTYSMLTPSVAATLSNTSLGQIRDVALCGEPLHKGSIERVLEAGSNPWIVYGPTETSIVNLGHRADASTHRSNLGYSFGATAWIVSAHDPNKLAPFGIPGELAFSGHTLAAGYYKDAEKTDAAFRSGLRWTENFHNIPNHRVYLTGDLARYNADGTIQFLGRIGGYTKIAGNRVDLGEIKYVLVNKCDMPDVSVMVCNFEDRDMLLCFFADQSSKAAETDECILVDLSAQAKSKVTNAIGKLEQLLPKYMMPSAWIPVNRIPITSSGKLDSVSLRRLISSLDLEVLITKYAVDLSEDADSLPPEIDDATAENQKSLKKAWAAVLSVKESNVNANSHFVRLGGDSLRAMELASNLRKSGLSLHVADIFASPMLSDMAENVKQRDGSTEVQMKPMFSDSEREDLLDAAAENLQIQRDAIESLSLCSSLQSQLMVASEQSQGSFLHRDCFRTTKGVDRDEISRVCGAMIVQNEMLRTRMFVDPKSGRFIQIILQHDKDYSLEVQDATLEQYLDHAPNQFLRLGGSLCRFVLLQSKDQDTVLVWEMHHSIYDGHSHIILLNRLQSLIEQQQGTQENTKTSEQSSSSAKYHEFIQYLMSVDQEPAREFWSSYLEGAPKNNLSIMKPVPPQSLTDSRTKIHVRLASKRSNFTMATYLRTAFALLISGYAASSDVSFSATINGRDLPVDGIAGLAGPTFATIPVRVKYDTEETVKSLLSRVQRDSADSATYQTMPIEEIGRISPSCKQACRFDMHLLVQSQSGATPKGELAKLGYEMMPHSPMQLRIPFNVVATASDNGFDLEAIYNKTAIDSAGVDLLLDQMSALLQSLVGSGEDAPVGSVFDLGEQNRKIIQSMQLKSEKDLEPASTIPELVLRHIENAADREAIHSTRSSITYRQLCEQAQVFASQIRETLTEPHSMVAFCFEKSVEGVVAQLAIMLAGHTFVPIDPSWPEARRSSVLEQTKCSLVVSSNTSASTFAESGIDVLTPSTADASSDSDCEVKASDIAYVLFTSGSTGKPKGVVVEHGAISRTLQAYAKRLSFTADTRALLFASFTFDASIMETWSVLVAGGTLCIASDDERISDLSGFICRSRADCVGITPTAAGLLQAEELANIKTLLFCGEKCRERDLAQWRERDVVLVNAYGPTEACVNAATNIDFRETDLNDVGTSLGGGLWIVNAETADQLLPVGSTGELVISGPVLAQGYLHAPEITAERFIKPKWPEWTKVRDGPVYRTGDLARLDANGRLHLLGRSDGQMKINGIRIEAEEVERSCSQADTTITDVIASTVSLSEESHELAAFFVTGSSSADKKSELVLPLSNKHPDLIAALRNTATRLLPPAFVPTLYIPVSRVPFSTSGKVDRKLLSETASQLHPSQLRLFRTGDDNASGTSTPKAEPHVNGTGSKDEPLSAAEEDMQSLWATVLHKDVSATNLTPDSHFIETGGDSVAAIRLAAVAKAKGANLPVSVIYANPRLRDMAKALEKRPATAQRTQSVHTPGAFDMIKDMEILTPEWISPELSPAVKRGKRNDYFGQENGV